MKKLTCSQANEPWRAHLLPSMVRHHIYDAWQQPVRGVYEPFLEHEAWQNVGLSLLCCSGSVEIHRDAEAIPPFCYHAVLINDGWVAKRPDQARTKSNQQLPGTIFLLTIHEPHHLVRDTRPEHQMPDYPGWASLVFNSPTSLEVPEIIARFNRITEITQ